jgi:hypothetical protein
MKINKFAVYNSDRELIDILDLNKKQQKEYLAAHPTHTLEDLLTDEDVLCDEDYDYFIDGYNDQSEIYL